MSIPVCGKEEHIPDVQGESDAGNMFADPVLEESQGSGSSNDEEVWQMNFLLCLEFYISRSPVFLLLN